MIVKYIHLNDLQTDFSYFIQKYGTDRTYMGWKFTIIGNGVKDLEYLYEKLNDFLTSIDATFKFGTTKLIGCNSGEQMFKLLTIYVMSDTDHKLLLNDLKVILSDYKPDCSLKKSEHIFGAIYKRCDLDDHGNYIPA